MSTQQSLIRAAAISNKTREFFFMKSLRIALACIGSSVAMSAAASGTYDLTTAPFTTSGATTFSSAASANCVMGSGSCVAAGVVDQTGGTDYGNSYTWSHATTGAGPGVTMSAWGSTAANSTSMIRKAFIGNYSPAGFGVTSQASGELLANGTPDTSGPHAIDNTSGYESLVMSFATAVTLNSLTIGYHNGGSDATVLEYVGAGDPTLTLGSLTGESYGQLVANGWRFVADVLNMQNGTAANIVGSSVASQYWMVGAYIPNLFGNGNGVADDFKLSGFVATAATVPEPGSIALFGIAGVALAVSRRRRKA
jgi:PEP-CTERM motif